MTLAVLLDDALGHDADGVTVRVSLPWIRSLPVASIGDLAVTVDGEPLRDPMLRLGDERITPDGLAHRPEWWFVQDRLVVTAAGSLTPGAHEVGVSFRLMIPYLPAGPDAPLALPFAATRVLDADAAGPAPAASRDVA